jgi:hypothetical protein
MFPIAQSETYIPCVLEKRFVELGGRERDSPSPLNDGFVLRLRPYRHTIALTLRSRLVQRNPRSECPRKTPRQSWDGLHMSTVGLIVRCSPILNGRDRRVSQT